MRHLGSSFLMAVLFCTTIANAQDFEVNDVYYNITSEENLTVAVTCKKAGEPDYEGEITIPEHVTHNGKTYTVTEIGEDAFMSCNGLISVAMPESIEKIGSAAFAWCSKLTKINIPKNVRFIGSAAFDCCIKLTSIQIPEGVKALYYRTFNSCSSLESAILPNSITYIANGVFTGCEALSTINLPDSLTSIGAYTFYGCYLLDSITIPSKVNSISSDAFAHCRELKSLKVVEENPIYDSRNNCNGIIETASNELVIGCSKTQIPAEVTTIKTYAFQGMPITDVVFPESLKIIEKEALRDCYSDKAVIIPASVERMDEYALYCSKIDSIIIRAQISHIESSTFEGCTNLSFIDLPNSIESIKNEAFRRCYSLNRIICRAQNPPTCAEYAFFDANKHATIEVPEESMPLYNEAVVWKDFYCIKSIESESTVELPDPNRIIVKKGYGTYYATEDGKCTYLYSYDYNELNDDPDNINWKYGKIIIDVDTIGPNAFSNCTFDKGQIIRFTENVKVILKDAFSYINILPRLLAYAKITDDLTLSFDSETPPNIANDNIIDYAKVWPVRINFLVPDIETYIKSDIQWTYTTIMTPEDVEWGYIKQEHKVHVSDTAAVNIDSSVENTNNNPDEEITVYATVRPRKDIPVRIGDGDNDIYSRAPSWMRYTIEIVMTDCNSDTLFTQKRQCRAYEQCDFEVKLSKYPEGGIVYIHSRSIDQYGRASEWTVETINMSTGINSTIFSTDSPYYDLMGRKVTCPTRGIYIKDGRKVVVK